LTKKRESTDDTPIEDGLGDHPEVAIDVEVRRIASESLMISADVDVVKPVSRRSADGTDQAEEAEV
jgi:hypothetical protein